MCHWSTYFDSNQRVNKKKFHAYILETILAYNTNKSQDGFEGALKRIANEKSMHFKKSWIKVIFIVNKIKLKLFFLNKVLSNHFF